MQQDMNVLSGFTVSQRMAICFAPGVIGALAPWSSPVTANFTILLR